MTALERAKAFVQSRAAKTALKIMPLALATVVSVSVKAHADSVPIFNGSNPQWNAVVPPSGAYLVLGCGTPGSCPDPTSGYSPYLNNGVTGYGMTGAQVLGAPGTAELDFVMTGTGSGQFFNSGVTVDWDFGVTCDATCKANENTPDPNNPGFTLDYFQYNVIATVDGNTVAYGGPVFYADPLGSFVIPVTPGDPVGNWSVEIDMFWTAADTGETATFTVNQLSLDPGQAPNVPEPASMLLAASGLPLLLRVIRRKR